MATMWLSTPVPPGPTTGTGLALHPTAAKLLKGLHSCGPELVPMPRFPETLIPHVQTVPSDRKARLLSVVEAIATTWESVP